MSGDKTIPRFGILLITGIVFLCVVPMIQIGCLQSGAATEINMSDLWIDPDPLSSVPASQLFAREIQRRPQ